MSKRFVTYRTEDQQAGLVNVDENGVLKTDADEGGSGGGAFFVRIDMDENNNYIADKTYDEICEAIRNGLIPYCLIGNHLLPLTGTNSGALSGIAPALAINPSEHVFCSIFPLFGNDTQYEIQSIKINERNNVAYGSHVYFFDSASN